MSPPPSDAAPRRSVSLELGSAIGAANADRVIVRGFDLVDDLLGEVGYTEMAMLTITGRRPTAAAVRVVDAVLVSLLDHGLTPSALAARLTYYVAPEALQGAVAAGLLGAGSLLLGSMERCGRLLTDIDGEVAAGHDARDAALRQVAMLLEAGERIPGVGHSLHRGGDPRAAKLLEIARAAGMAGRHVEHLEFAVKAAAELCGKELPLNATGSAAALLLEARIPWQLHRGFALMSRTAGLVAHIGEELTDPLTPAVRTALRESSRVGDT